MEEDQPRVLDPITGPSEPYVDYDCKTGLLVMCLFTFGLN